MGHSQAEKEATHLRIVEVAARRFREVGIDGIGVADVMKEAGLTVGGFYKHFRSRDHLVAEAVARAFQDLDAWEDAATSLAQMVSEFSLTEAHRDAPGSGCGVCALVGDIGRSNAEARGLYTSRVKRSLALWDTLLMIDDPAERRARALLLLSTIVGAVNLARAVSDPALSREILASVARQLLPLLPERASR